MSDEQRIDIMMEASAKFFNILVGYKTEPDTPTVRALMQAILDAQRKAGILNRSTTGETQ